ncbi:MAG: CBS domain-containing protein [Candidatus Korarchaeum sp.]|nr:CBS domain-containing protein [Candidatus Korarchaeum sp.]MDW8035474.1 CBS domain-containing protein [Candidatus Korarchaeum sp.]
MPLLRRKRELPLRVEDVMTSPAVTVKMNTPVEEAAKVMDEKRISSILVVDDSGKLVGIFTDRDLRFAAANGKIGKGIPIHMMMTENPITISPSDPITEALRKMRDADVKHLPVVDKENKPVGVIASRDVLDAVMILMQLMTGQV